VLLPIVLQMAYHCGQRMQCCDIRTYGALINLPGLRAGVQRRCCV